MRSRYPWSNCTPIECDDTFEQVSSLDNWRSLIALNRVAESTGKQLLLAGVRWTGPGAEISSVRFIVRDLRAAVDLVQVSRWMPEMARSRTRDNQ